MAARKRKASKGVKILEAFILFLIVIVTGFAGIHYSSLYNKEINNVDSLVESLNDMIPNEVSTNLILKTKVEGYENITIVWSSSKQTIINPDGSVKQPSYLEGDTIVTLTATFVVLKDNGLAQLAFNLFGFEAKSTTFTIKVLKKAATVEEKLNYAASSIYVPERFAVNIGLITEIPIFDDLTISWESQDVNIISHDGVVNNSGTTDLIATISVGEESKIMTYSITVLDENELIEDYFQDFNNIATGTYGEDWTKSDITFHQAIIADKESEKVVRLKANNDASLIIGRDFVKPTTISFTYQIYETDKDKLNKPTFIRTYYGFNNVWTLINETKVENANLNTLEFTIPIQNAVNFKIETESEYSTDLRIDIDKIFIYREVSNDDIENWLKRNIDSKVSASIVLPKTTYYGGIITWSSQNTELISNKGIVNQKEQSQDVNLVASISGFKTNFSVTITLTIIGTTAVEPLEVYFIDIGKYGGSDTGESMYIRLGDIDILIDAGDNYSTTKQSISELLSDKSADGIFEYVIATHPDADHIGGMPEIFAKFEVKNLIQFYGTHTTALYSSYVNSYQAEGLVSECTIVDSLNNTNGCKNVIEIADQITITFVDTGHYLVDEPNGRSIVFVLEAYGTRVLFTGDADNAYNRQLEQYYMNAVGDIDILKVVHHGTKYGTSSEFLNAVTPEVVIITNGNHLGNKHGHPTADAINRIYQLNRLTKIYAVTGGDDQNCQIKTSGAYECSPTDRFLDRNGTILITIDNNGYYITAEYSEIPIELSSTSFWKNHPHQLYSYGQ